MGKRSIFGLEPDQLDELLSVASGDPDESKLHRKQSPSPHHAKRFEKPQLAETTASLQGSTEPLRNQIGPYELLRLLGEGGMGMVYLAEQKRPIKRQVALKIIKPGMDSKRVIARFEAERQTLALLDHPNIAHVYDAGTTEASQPYFVMEYVKGLSITEHCDHHKLTIEDRLRLFRQVCLAVHHAHQKGIIHRDIKPSNILVSLQDDQALPKIIDFGIAKALAQPLTERTIFTEQGQLFGTPEYMSPEQADMANEDIDTRSDIYSLGILLYVLLTGVLPFDSTTFREGGIEHIRQVIREADPKTPSIRLTKLGEEAKKIASSRRTKIEILARRLHRELEWIPLKAMRKERGERYRSASELADDIENYLKGNPLIAGPPGILYRLKKLVRRNATLSSAVLAAVVTLIVGLIATTAMYVRANHARAEAQAVSEFLRKDVLWSLDLWRTGGREVTARSVLDTVSEKLGEKFADKPLVEALIRRELGATYTFLGLYEEAERQFKRTLDIHLARFGTKHHATLISMWDLGWVYWWQSRYHEAEPLLTKALEGMELTLDEDDEDRLYCMAILAWLYNIQGRFNEAEQLFGEGLSTVCHVLGEENVYSPTFIQGLAWAHVLQGRYKQAEQMYNRGLEISRRVRGEQDMETLALISHLGDLYRLQGCYTEAESLLDKALDGKRHVLGEQHSQTLETMVYLGWLYCSQGRYKDAESMFDETLSTARRVLGDTHLTTAECVRGLGTVYLNQDKQGEAERLFEEALEIIDQVLGGENWATLSIKSTLAKLYTAQDRYEDAEKLFETTLEAQRRTLGDNYPDTLTSINNLAMLRTKQKQYEDAERLFHEALEARKLKLGDDHPDTLQTKNDWAMLYKEQAQYEKAEPLLFEAIEGRRLKLGDTHPHTIESIKNLIELYEAWNKPEKAEEWRSKLPKTEAVDE
jgi:serine/threonine protein kinase/Tfp pilus assembly protein PilF